MTYPTTFDPPSLEDEAEDDAEAGVCRSCMRGDHGDCAIITWAAGTCLCGACKLVVKP